VEIRREEFVQQLRELIPQKVYGRDWKSCQTAATGSNEF